MNITVDKPVLNLSGQDLQMELEAETLTLTLTEGPVTLGGAQPYEHIQSIPSAVWTVEHNLGRMPSVTVLTSAGDVVYGHVNHSDINELTITFSAAFAGRAYLV
jgi:hypothetical protein